MEDLFQVRALQTDPAAAGPAARPGPRLVSGLHAELWHPGSRGVGGVAWVPPVSTRTLTVGGQCLSCPHVCRPVLIVVLRARLGGERAPSCRRGVGGRAGQGQLPGTTSLLFGSPICLHSPLELPAPCSPSSFLGA